MTEREKMAAGMLYDLFTEGMPIGEGSVIGPEALSQETFLQQPCSRKSLPRYPPDYRKRPFTPLKRHVPICLSYEYT